jgi:lysophospholipase L1-like esterase
VNAAGDAMWPSQRSSLGPGRSRPPSELWIAENDGHPNALGNRLIADRLQALLEEVEPRVRPAAR